jgi:predicted nucleotidyltransferase
MIKELIPLSTRKFKILSTLYFHEKLYANEIAKLTGLEKSHISNYLKELRNDKIIFVKDKISNAVIYSLNSKASKILSDLFEEHKKELLFEKYPIIKRLHLEIKSAQDEKISDIYLIGSYVKETITKNSDIDLIIIVDKTDREAFVERINRFQKLEKVKIHPTFFSPKEWELEKSTDSIFFQTTLKHKKDRIKFN